MINQTKQSFDRHPRSHMDAEKSQDRQHWSLAAKNMPGQLRKHYEEKSLAYNVVGVYYCQDWDNPKIGTCEVTLVKGTVKPRTMPNPDNYELTTEVWHWVIVDDNSQFRSWKHAYSYDPNDDDDEIRSTGAGDEELDSDDSDPDDSDDSGAIEPDAPEDYLHVSGVEAPTDGNAVEATENAINCINAQAGCGR